MRLLNARTGAMKDFMSEGQTPPYAILSHTWGNEEVTYRDWESLATSEIERMEGYEKIGYSRGQAVADGLDWIWVDT